MMEAARALTVLGRARLVADGEAPRQEPAFEVIALYQTAERLGQHVRQVSDEARALLGTALQLLDAEPVAARQVPVDFHDVCRMMDEAMDRAVEAVGRLDAMRMADAPAAVAFPAAPVPTPEAVQEAEALFRRLRGPQGG